MNVVALVYTKELSSTEDKKEYVCVKMRYKKFSNMVIDMHL